MLPLHYARIEAIIGDEAGAVNATCAADGQTAKGLFKVGIDV
ncbi:MAG: hypothetical protein Q8R28_07720 [Dehalococcoidia bacterium]|nr:hypothetical protein [Dehalococcoidia bacterium]